MEITILIKINMDLVREIRIANSKYPFIPRSCLGVRRGVRGDMNWELELGIRMELRCLI
jgi:hypothetical protein